MATTTADPERPPALLPFARATYSLSLPLSLPAWVIRQEYPYGADPWRFRSC